ncbi:MAG: lysophospholipid acyltransferase family protein [candidate division WOR-3 bacterium]|nr:lysophospholipid acyltransferase family protein [candidate division WOR-3 bacterium]MDW7988175.1 lysophospholipid acyltransferase family protein [candidate division WOR-3 bacterium]
MAAKIAIYLIYPFLIGPRKVIRKNFYYIGEEINSHKIREVILHYILFIADFYQVKKLNLNTLKQRVRITGLNYLDDLVKNRASGILVTGHLGNWELAGIYLAALGYPLTAVVEDIGPLVEFLLELREKTGMETILTTETRKVIKAIRAKRILVLLGDRDVTKTGVLTPFLYGQKKLPSGPAYLAKRFNLPVFSGYFVYTPDYNYFKAQIEPVKFPLDSDVRGIQCLIADKIGSYIKKYPTQWIVFQDEWC